MIRNTTPRAASPKRPMRRDHVRAPGDISAHTEKSGPLRDFVYESNKRGDVRFVTTVDEL